MPDGGLQDLEEAPSSGLQPMSGIATRPPGPDPDPLSELDTVARSARERERRSWVFLGMLALVGVAAVGAGVVADSEVFWAVSGSVFFMAAAGIVAYAASSLGVTADLLDLIARNAMRERG